MFKILHATLCEFECKTSSACVCFWVFASFSCPFCYAFLVLEVKGKVIKQYNIIFFTFFRLPKLYIKQLTTNSKTLVILKNLLKNIMIFKKCIFLIQVLYAVGARKVLESASSKSLTKQKDIQCTLPSCTQTKQGRHGMSKAQTQSRILWQL